MSDRDHLEVQREGRYRHRQERSAAAPSAGAPMVKVARAIAIVAPDRAHNPNRHRHCGSFTVLYGIDYICHLRPRNRSSSVKIDNAWRRRNARRNPRVFRDPASRVPPGFSSFRCRLIIQIVGDVLARKELRFDVHLQISLARQLQYPEIFVWITRCFLESINRLIGHEYDSDRVESEHV